VRAKTFTINCDADGCDVRATDVDPDSLGGSGSFWNEVTLSAGLVIDLCPECYARIVRQLGVRC